MSEPIPLLLGPYAAKLCPRRIHNDLDRTIPRVTDFERTAPVELRREGARDHKRAMQQLLATRLAERAAILLDLTDLGLDRQAQIATTHEAMAHGIAVIASGWLPDDLPGRREGRVDLLIREQQPGPDGRYGYWPALIKNHKTIRPFRPENPPRGEPEVLIYTTLDLPGYDVGLIAEGLQVRARGDDVLELAHNWRMLTACGFAAAGTPRGAVIGSDQLHGETVLAWQVLDFDAYDREFDFRVSIADVARSRTGAPSDPEPLVEPIYVRECDGCPWQSSCMDLLGPDDASAEVGKLSAGEWLTLRGQGVRTTAQLAALDPAAAPDPRVRDAIFTARMALSGDYLMRTTAGPIELERADIEVDLDIESDRDGRVYLWGMLVTDSGSDAPARYESALDWAPLDDVREARVGAQFWSMITGLAQIASESGKSLKIYHYSTPEPNHLLKLAARGEDPALGLSGLPTVAAARDFIDRYFIDLLPVMRGNFLGRKGLGLKMSATKGPGFQWRDDDPGGAQSQVWLQIAYADYLPAAREQSRVRILEYNEDDVQATLALRKWLTANG